MRKVLITGGSGFIGRHLVRHAQYRGWEGVVVDWSPDHPQWGRGYVHWKVDVAGLDRFDRTAFRNWNPNVIFHLAAQTSIPRSLREPEETLRVNVGGTRAMADLAEQTGAVLVLSSTSAVYGDRPTMCHELDPLTPDTPYGHSKMQAEEAIADLAGARVLRYGNVYGPGQRPDADGGVVALFAGQVARGDPVTLFGDGRQTRDYVHVRDVVQANVLAAAYDRQMTANVGSGYRSSVLDLVWHLEQAIGHPIERRFEGEREGDAYHSRLVCEEMFRLFGWRAGTMLHEGIRDTLPSYLIPDDASERNRGDH